MLHRYLFLFVFILFSCSDNEKEPENSSVEPDFLELKINGAKVDIGLQPIYKIEDEFYINYSSPLLKFNLDHKFGAIKLNYTNPETNISKNFYSFYAYSSNYMNLNLQNIDLVGKRVKLLASGYIYSDPYNLNSEKKYFELSVNSGYKEVIPTVFGLKNTAKINGANWVRTNEVQKPNRIPFHYERYIQEEYSENEYMMEIYYENGLTIPGTYNFTNSDDINKIILKKYNISTNTYITYLCSGNLKISNLSSNRYYIGEYSFTAINPNDPTDVINVTDGNFKIISKYL